MRSSKRNRGFSLLEMMVSVAILLVITGAAFAALSQSQKAYGTQQLQADMHAGVRGTVELMTQEIGQAGSLNFAPQTIPSAVTGSTTAQAVTLSSAANIYVGEVLTVDTGSNQEFVTVTAVNDASNQVTGIFKNSHVAATPVVALGVFPNGVLTTAAGNSLQIFGDINGDGTLTYVEYDCNPGTTTAPGTLTRTSTVLAPGVTTQNAPQTLLTTLLANPSGTPCFTPSMGIGGSVTAGNCNVSGISSTLTCVTDMQVMLTVQTAEEDPNTHSFTAMTKSVLNLSSRNVFAAYAIATSTSPTASLMQQNPPGLPLLAP